jgi:hypothetical protein
MGALLLISLICTLTASLVFVPALLAVLDREPRRRSAVGATANAKTRLDCNTITPRAAKATRGLKILHAAQHGAVEYAPR